MTKSYHGSCHCGAVRFECEIDLAHGTSRCDCSICAKSRYWKAIVKADAFRLLQGHEALSEYRFPGNTIYHCFCRRCGIKPFGRGHWNELGGAFYGVNVACLDDATTTQLAEATVRYQDGRNNNWKSPPAETRHL